MRKYLADAASGAEMGQGCGVWCCILAQIGIMAQRAALQTKAEGNVLQTSYTKPLVWTKPSDLQGFLLCSGL